MRVQIHRIDGKDAAAVGRERAQDRVARVRIHQGVESAVGRRGAVAVEHARLDQIAPGPQERRSGRVAPNSLPGRRVDRGDSVVASKSNHGTGDNGRVHRDGLLVLVLDADLPAADGPVDDRLLARRRRLAPYGLHIGKG